MLTPIYLVMMVGSPLAGKLADRIGPGWLVLPGLGAYACGLVVLSWMGLWSTIVPDVLAGIVIFATGMAMFTAPLAAATMGALDEEEQGLASGMKQCHGQFAGLMGIALLPAWPASLLMILRLPSATATVAETASVSLLSRCLVAVLLSQPEQRVVLVLS